MINSFLIFGGAYKTSKFSSAAFFMLWVLYALVSSNFAINMFLPLNILAVIVTIIIAGTSKKLNGVLSAFSVLIYSIIIDVLCFYIYPEFVFGLSLPHYVYNGIVFNFKNIALPVVLAIIIAIFKTAANWKKAAYYYEI